MTTQTTLPAGTWQLDPAASTVTISVKKLGVLTVPATLTITSGTIEIGDDGDVNAVDVIVDAASYTSKNPKRNEHVSGPDFLDAAAHPTIGFQAGDVAPAGAGYTCQGTVTVKGTTSPVDVTISDVTVDGAAGSFTATATVDRTAIGVDKMPGFIIGRELQLTVNATATATS